MSRHLYSLEASSLLNLSSTSVTTYMSSSSNRSKSSFTIPNICCRIMLGILIVVIVTFPS
jgi:hypothetical protein